MPFVSKLIKSELAGEDASGSAPELDRSTINPPLRQRPCLVSPDSRANAKPERSPCKPKAASKPKKQPTGDYEQGYCVPPVEHQFKKGNPGGPGRPKGRQSQDTLLRAELETKQTVRLGGRELKLSKRALAATLWVNTTIEKRDTKQLAALNSESRRLFPEVVEAAKSEAFDPAIEQQVLRQLIEQLTLGEPMPDGVDPLADLATSGPDLGRADAQGAWTEGEWSSEAESLTDDD